MALAVATSREVRAAGAEPGAECAGRNPGRSRGRQGEGQTPPRRGAHRMELAGGQLGSRRPPGSPLAAAKPPGSCAG